MLCSEARHVLTFSGRFESLVGLVGGPNNHRSDYQQITFQKHHRKTLLRTGMAFGLGNFLGIFGCFDDSEVQRFLASWGFRCFHDVFEVQPKTLAPWFDKGDLRFGAWRDPLYQELFFKEQIMWPFFGIYKHVYIYM